MSLPQRTIGRGSASLTGSAVAFGCMSLVGGLNSGSVDEDASIKVIRHALSTGVNILNTADLYGTSTPAFSLFPDCTCYRLQAPQVSWRRSAGRKQENEIAIGEIAT